jgi:hypothetical protein
VKIFDTFLFRDELDMLECRLRQFDQYPVYRHVLVEAPVDHRGHPKPLFYAENKERFAPWADQIVHVVADELTTLGPPSDVREQAWLREAAQREAIGRGLAAADSDDQLIFADVDEIPNATAIAAVQDGWTGVFQMTCCLFAVDWVWDQLTTSSVTRAGSVTSFALARRQVGGPVLADAGHHLTWLGDAASMQRKLAATCHVEVIEETMAALAEDTCYRQGVNPFDQYGLAGRQLHPVDVDMSWPKWVHDRRCPPGWFRPREIPGGRGCLITGC